MFKNDSENDSSPEWEHTFVNVLHKARKFKQLYSVIQKYMEVTYSIEQ